MEQYNYFYVDYANDLNFSTNDAEELFEQSEFKNLTHIYVGIIFFLLSFFSIILQLLVFSSFLIKRDLFKNTCFLIIYHHGVLSFIQQLCHIITSIITIFDIINVDLLLIIIGSLLNSTYIGSVLFIFLLTLNRFGIFYNINNFCKGDERSFYIFGIVFFYACIVALFVFYLIPRFRMTYYIQIYNWEYIHPLRGILGFEIESRTIYIFLGISFVLQILVIIKIFYIRCYTSKNGLFVAGNLKILIHAFLCFVTTTVLELIWDGVLFEFYTNDIWIIVPYMLHIFCSVSNTIFVLCFVREIRNNMILFNLCKKLNKVISIT